MVLFWKVLDTLAVPSWRKQVTEGAGVLGCLWGIHLVLTPSCLSAISWMLGDRKLSSLTSCYDAVPSLRLQAVESADHGLKLLTLSSVSLSSVLSVVKTY